MQELFRMIVKGQQARLPSHVSLEADDLIKNMLQKSVRLAILPPYRSQRSNGHRRLLKFVR